MSWPNKVLVLLDICVQHISITEGPDHQAIVRMETRMRVVQALSPGLRIVIPEYHWNGTIKSFHQNTYIWTAVNQTQTTKAAWTTTTMKPRFVKFMESIIAPTTFLETRDAEVIKVLAFANFALVEQAQWSSLAPIADVVRKVSLLFSEVSTFPFWLIRF
jgi:hypothetical protein